MQKPLHRITIAIRAEQDEIDGLVDRLGLALCGDLQHDGECENPWFITSIGEVSMTVEEIVGLAGLVDNDPPG